MPDFFQMARSERICLTPHCVWEPCHSSLCPQPCQKADPQSELSWGCCCLRNDSNSFSCKYCRLSFTSRLFKMLDYDCCKTKLQSSSYTIQNLTCLAKTFNHSSVEQLILNTLIALCTILQNNPQHSLQSMAPTPTSSMNMNNLSLWSSLNLYKSSSIASLQIILTFYFHTIFLI